MTSTIPPAARSTRFLLVYALAYAGGVISYLPLLTLLLPIKVEAVAGDARIGVFSATVLAGAVAASVSNIIFGWFSDRSVARGGGRRAWLAGGVAATALSFVAVASAASPLALVFAVVAFQTAVNALLAPLVAIMADEVPDRQKGVAGGLLAFGNPAASALSGGVLSMALLGEAGRFAIVMAVCAGCILPLLLTPAHPITETYAPSADPALPRRDLAIAWGARLLVQIAGNVLSLYLLYYFESVTAGGADRNLPADIGHLMTVAFIVPLPVAVLVGRLSDRTGRRKPFLLAAAVTAAVGLALMAVAEDWTGGATGFGLYAVGSSVFLTLHAAFAMQLLPSPRHRGRDLGLLNLANTLPALLGPPLAWALATPGDFDALMLSLAALTLCGGVTILAAGGRR